MVKSNIKLLSGLHLFQSKVTFLHSQLLHLIDSTSPDSIPNSPSKVSIDLSTFQQIATIASTLASSDSQFQFLIHLCESNTVQYYKILSKTSSFKQELQYLKSTTTSAQRDLNSQFKRLLGILNQYRQRCRNSYIGHLKNLDLDLRKILLPLVPSSVISQNIKYPQINDNGSLQSSVTHSRHQSIQSNLKPGDSFDQRTQPDPAQVVNQKLNSHIQMLVNSLEGIAKQLMQMLADTNKQYYQALNKAEFLSRPPTPLAAPLPEYFCYQNDEIPDQSNEIYPVVPKSFWLKRLHRLKLNNEITDIEAQMILDNIQKYQQEKLSIQDIFKDIKLPVLIVEKLAFFLVNTSKIPVQDVTLSDMIEEEKKPEPPKEPKSRQRYYPRLEKSVQNKLDATIEEYELKRDDSSGQNVPVLQGRKPVFKRKAAKAFEYKIQRKDVRVRSYTPIGKLKQKILPRKKTRTPVYRKQNSKKVSLTKLY